MALPLEATGVKPLRVPPITSTSSALKVLLASLRVKVRVSVLPVLSVSVPARATMMLGAVLSASAVL